MNTKKIKFDGEIHAFPSDFTDEEISQALQGSNSNEKSGFLNNLIKEVKATKGKNTLETAANVADVFNKGFEKYTGLPHAARGFIQGGEDILRGVGNLPHYLHLPGAPDEIPSANFGKMPIGNGQENLLQKAAELGGGIAGIGGAYSKLLKGGEAALKSTKIPKYLQGLINNTGVGAVLSPDNREVGAALGAGGHAGAKLLEEVLNRARPSQLFRGELSAEQLAKNLENTKGTETGLGQVIESPSLQRLSENVLPHVIGSGAEKAMQRTANKVTEQGEELLHGLRGGEEVHENYGEKIKNALKESAAAAEHEKTSKFKKVNELAEKHNITTDRSNLRKEAKSILAQIKSDPDLAQFTNSGDIKLLEEIVNPSRTPSSHAPGNVNVITGKPTQTPHSYSLKNTDILRGKIGENAHEANIKGEKPKASIYARLKKALEQDVSGAIENSSHQELKNAHKEAMDYYKNEYAPYKDKDIQKFVKQGGDPDLILSHFLKMGSNDRVHLLRKLSQYTEGKSNLIGNAYLSPAYEEGKLNPIKLSSLYHKLGKRQQIELFGKENSQKLRNYTDLARKNKEGFNLMFNPKTGARLGHIGSLLTAGAHLPTALGISGLGNIANRILTSESFRDKLIKAMIKDKKVKFPRATENLLKSSAITINNKR